MKTIKLKINEQVAAELTYIVKLHTQHEAPARMGTVEDLINYILASIADGSRRPGSWERGLLIKMGLVAECNEHEIYRAHYGEPDNGERHQ